MDNLAFAEIEENDVDLKKLQSWLVKIRKLDYCKATLAALLMAAGTMALLRVEKWRNGGAVRYGI